MDPTFQPAQSNHQQGAFRNSKIAEPAKGESEEFLTASLSC